MIQLDTNFLIRVLVRGSAEDQMLRNWLRQGEAIMNTVAWAEFLCGPIAPDHLELASAIVSERVPFLEVDSVKAAKLFNASGRRRGSFADCMIAATALRLEAPLATANPSDFVRFKDEGLLLLTA